MMKLEGINRRIINPYSNPVMDKYFSKDIMRTYSKKSRTSYMINAIIQNRILKITKEIF